MQYFLLNGMMTPNQTELGNRSIIIKNHVVNTLQLFCQIF